MGTDCNPVTACSISDRPVAVSNAASSAPRRICETILDSPPILPPAKMRKFTPPAGALRHFSRISSSDLW